MVRRPIVPNGFVAVPDPIHSPSRNTVGAGWRCVRACVSHLAAREGLIGGSVHFSGAGSDRGFALRRRRGKTVPDGPAGFVTRGVTPPLSVPRQGRRKYLYLLDL